MKLTDEQRERDILAYAALSPKQIARLLVDAKSQLNQAIEVLKWYADGETWFADPRDSSSIAIRDRGQRARDFLSSLQEDKI